MRTAVVAWGLVLVVALASLGLGSQRADAATSGLSLSVRDTTCTLKGSWLIDWLAQSSASEALTIDSFTASAPIGGQVFSVNPVPAGGSSVLLTTGPSVGGTVTLTVTFHGSDNTPQTATGSTTIGTCFPVPCVTAPGGCFPTTSTTALPTSTIRPVVAPAPTARSAAVAAQPRFTG